MVYESSYVYPIVPECGTWHYHHPSPPVFDPSLPAFIDGVTGRTLKRADIKNDSLRMVTGLRKIGVKRGAYALTFGLNSLEYIQVSHRERREGRAFS